MRIAVQSIIIAMTALTSGAHGQSRINAISTQFRWLELLRGRELLAQRILTATLLPGRLWPRVQLPTLFGTKPFLI